MIGELLLTEEFRFLFQNLFTIGLLTLNIQDVIVQLCVGVTNLFFLQALMSCLVMFQFTLTPLELAKSEFSAMEVV